MKLMLVRLQWVKLMLLTTVGEVDVGNYSG